MSERCQHGFVPRSCPECNDQVSRDADRRESIALEFAVVLSDHMGAEAAAECGFLYADAFIAEAKRQRQREVFAPLEITFETFAVLQPDDGSAPTFKATIQHKGTWYTIEAKMQREANP